MTFIKISHLKLSSVEENNLFGETFKLTCQPESDHRQTYTPSSVLASWHFAGSRPSVSIIHIIYPPICHSVKENRFNGEVINGFLRLIEFQ